MVLYVSSGCLNSSLELTYFVELADTLVGLNMLTIKPPNSSPQPSSQTSSSPRNMNLFDWNLGFPRNIRSISASTIPELDVKKDDEFYLTVS
nr:hypothetical protein CFP56_06058 [Quercus suber]